MKTISVTLTQEQAQSVVIALEQAQDNGYPKTDAVNLHLQRIINKIERAQQ